VGFRLNAPPAATARVFLDGVAIEARFDFAVPPPAPPIGGDPLVLFHAGGAFVLSTVPDARAGAVAAGDDAVRAPMPGRIVQVAAAAGEAVVRGQTLVVLEAMKMEHTLAAPYDGQVAEVAVREGQQVAEGAVMARLVARDTPR